MDSNDFKQPADDHQTGSDNTDNVNHAEAVTVRNGDGQWVTALGDVLPIRSMEDGHLVNATLLVERRTKEHMDLLIEHFRDVMRCPLTPPSLYDLMEANEALLLESDITEYLPDKHKELIAELVRRDSDVYHSYKNQGGAMNREAIGNWTSVS